MDILSPMHIDTSLVHRLICSQFPQWSHLSIEPVKLGGWDNRTFHLGEHMLVRLPSAEQYADKVEKEQYWLPKLAPYLFFSIPLPLAMGKPTEEYPFNWSIYKWIESEIASPETIFDTSQFAIDLAHFLIALQSIDTIEGPVAGQHNFYRGGSLKMYNTQVGQAIAKLSDTIDFGLIRQIWNQAITSEWNKPLVWVHGDIAPTNLLVRNGKLAAVIDFGGLCIGDPACDYSIAWTFFSAQSRATFRNVLTVDDRTWSRARGWAL